MDWIISQVVRPRWLLDGTRSGWFELLAARKVKGVWQYRRPTTDELLEEQYKQAW